MSRAAILTAMFVLAIGSVKSEAHDNCASIRAFNDVHPHSEQKHLPCHCTPKNDRVDKVTLGAAPPGWVCDSNYLMYDKQCHYGTPCDRKGTLGARR